MKLNTRRPSYDLAQETKILSMFETPANMHFLHLTQDQNGMCLPLVRMLPTKMPLYPDWYTNVDVSHVANMDGGVQFSPNGFVC